MNAHRGEAPGGYHTEKSKNEVGSFLRTCTSLSMETAASLPGDEVKQDRLRQKVGAQFDQLPPTTHFTLLATTTGRRRLGPFEMHIYPLTMDNNNRSLASFERISSSAKISNPNV